MSRLKSQLLRAIRGPKAQSALSRKLGYRGNQVYRWESGEREMAWPDFVRFCRACDGDLDAALGRIFGFRGNAVDFSELFSQVLGDVNQADVAETLQCSRYSVSRWLNGKTVPHVEHFLALIHHFHFVLFEFVAALANPNEIPMLRRPYRLRQLQKEVHYRYPVTDALLTCCELDEYRDAAKVPQGFFARKLGLTPAYEREVLHALNEAKVIRILPSGKVVLRQGRPDLRGNKSGMNAIRKYWLNEAIDYLDEHDVNETHSSFGTVVLPSNRAAAEKIKAEYYAFYHRVRTILQASHGEKDRVQVFNFQLFDLGGG